MKAFILSTLLIGAQYADPSQAADKRGDTTPGIDLKIPTYVSYDVVARADDLRASIGGLIGALSDAGPTFGYGDWKKEQRSLNAQSVILGKLGNRLALKKERADNDTWSAFVYSPTYSTTIHTSLKIMGEGLNQIASGMQGFTKSAAKTSMRVADDLVDQVDDVRGDVVALVDSIESGGRGFTYFQWNLNEKVLTDFHQRLNKIEASLDHKEVVSDEEWTAWLGTDVYKVAVHASVGELGAIVSGLATAMSGTSGKAAH